MEFIVEASGDRLDKFLTAHLEKFSRTRLQRLIKDGSIKVNGIVIEKPGFKLRPADKITIGESEFLLPDKEFVVEPDSDIPLDIIYEDKDIVVINKQAGLVVHPTPRQHRHTLANALVAKYPSIASVGESTLRPGIVHRLDKDTSGLMVIAKNQKAFMSLKQQFLDHTVSKIYLALVEGVPAERKGEINFQIRPSALNRLKKIAVRHLDTSGRKSIRSAETHYKVKNKIGNNFALLEVTPKTGRTHQIRVHLNAIGHAVLGDTMYHAKNPKDYGPLKELMKRQMLHAYRLKIVSPNGKKLDLESPMPEDMNTLIKALKKIKTAE